MKGFLLCVGVAVFVLLAILAVHLATSHKDAPQQVGIASSAADAETGLVARWDFEGGEVRTMKGCAEVEDAERGKCLRLQSSDSRALLTAAAPLPQIGSSVRAYSLALRLKPDTDVLSDAEVALAKLGGRRATKFASAMHDGKWHHVVITFDPERKGKEYALYLDWHDEKSPWRFMSYYDKEKDKNVFTSVIPVSFGSESLTFGGKIGWAVYSVGFHGLIDDVEVYDKLLPLEKAPHRP